MFEKGIRGGICHAIHRYAKANNKNMKSYVKNKESSYIQYFDAKNCMDGQWAYDGQSCSQMVLNGKKYVKI